MTAAVLEPNEPDPLALAEVLQQTLDELQEPIPCAEPGCDAWAFPEGPAFDMGGVDFDGSEKRFWFRWWACGRGHRYMLETEVHHPS